MDYMKKHRSRYLLICLITFPPPKIKQILIQKMKVILHAQITVLNQVYGHYKIIILTDSKAVIQDHLANLLVTEF